MIINAIAVTPGVAEGWISSLCDLSDPRAIYIRTEMDRLRALASGDALDEGKNTIARTIAGKLMRAGLLNEPHAPEPPDDLMDQITAIVVTALAAPSPLMGTPPSEEVARLTLQLAAAKVDVQDIHADAEHWHDEWEAVSDELETLKQAIRNYADRKALIVEDGTKRYPAGFSELMNASHLEAYRSMQEFSGEQASRMISVKQELAALHPLADGYAGAMAERDEARAELQKAESERDTYRQCLVDAPVGLFGAGSRTLEWKSVRRALLAHPVAAASTGEGAK